MSDCLLLLLPVIIKKVPAILSMSLLHSKSKKQRYSRLNHFLLWNAYLGLSLFFLFKGSEESEEAIVLCSGVFWAIVQQWWSKPHVSYFQIKKNLCSNSTSLFQKGLFLLMVICCWNILHFLQSGAHFEGLRHQSSCKYCGSFGLCFIQSQRSSGWKGRWSFWNWATHLLHWAGECEWP